MINPDHLAMLAASGITADYAAKRGYETITQKGRLAQIKIVQAARGQVPGLLVPLLRVDGSTWGWQYRPDVPRICLWYRRFARPSPVAPAPTTPAVPSEKK